MTPVEADPGQDLAIPDLPDGTVATGRRLQVGEITLHVVEAGPPEAPAVILLHGFPEYWRAWRRQIGPLAGAGYRVVVPDQRGYNLSDKPEGLSAYGLERLVADVLALADALGLARFHLVGHDWGAIVASAAAARHPGRVGRLAILNGPHPGAMREAVKADPAQLGRSWYVLFFQLPWLPERLLGRRSHAGLARALVSSSRRGTFPPVELDRYREAWSRPGALRAMLSWYRALLRRPPSRSGRVAVPTLILWGRRDAALGPAVATESLALCRDGRIRWFDRATHWLQHEEPEAVSAALIDFLGEDRAGPPSALTPPAP